VFFAVFADVFVDRHGSVPKRISSL
jgi:hypothetical protein